MRFCGKSKMPYNYEIIHDYIFKPDSVWELEVDIKKELEDFKYEPLIQFHGKSECFSSIDCLESYFEYLSELQ